MVWNAEQRAMFFTSILTGNAPRGTKGQSVRRLLATIRPRVVANCLDNPLPNDRKSPLHFVPSCPGGETSGEHTSSSRANTVVPRTVADCRSSAKLLFEVFRELIRLACDEGPSLLSRAKERIPCNCAIR
jgi:hypothetical protein